ncbi:MAG: dTDP-4-dehydrorhamnose reductase [Bacteroidetes bacterium]|nr:dTDP-4-dehydrorhamnose reductase [Bacteroidota bacterium]
MIRILVTGANGQVGSELKFLAAHQEMFQCTFVSRSELDITDAAAVERYFAQEHFDYLINCAAYTAVDKAETERDAAFQINATAPSALADVAHRHRCRYIHISTDFVFDGTASQPISEEATTHPLSVYGASKLAGDVAVQQYNPEALIIRTSWVYSSFGNNFVKTILRLCKEREQLNVIYDQIGTPTYARDLAACLFYIIGSGTWVPGIFNYSNEGVASWYDFAVAIKDIAGLHTQISPIETVQYPTPATRPKFSVLNKKKIKETYAIRIPYWRESLEDCIKLL